MCGIAGFYHRERDYGEQEQHYRSLLGRMHQELWRRGPDDAGIYLAKHCGLSHSRLSIIDISGGHQPMLRTAGEKHAALPIMGSFTMGRSCVGCWKAGDGCLPQTAIRK